MRLGGPHVPRVMTSPAAGGAGFGRAAARGRTRDQLYEEAKDLAIEGRSSMNKEQLLRAVNRRSGPEERIGRAGRGSSRPASGDARRRCEREDPAALRLGKSSQRWAYVGRADHIPRHEHVLQGRVERDAGETVSKAADVLVRRLAPIMHESRRDLGERGRESAHAPDGATSHALQRQRLVPDERVDAELEAEVEVGLDRARRVNRTPSCRPRSGLRHAPA